ncbi:MAG: hypothetical protein KDC34_17520 [Saprospiraceae bacterium]|nr:hypothetical protein [Saprospiraceae bacterium]
MRISLFLLAFFFCSLSANAQLSDARLFWDIPGFYATVPNVSIASEQAGFGLETVFNFAAHYGTARAGGGATFTINPSSDDIPGSFQITPYFLAEAGGGLYRTNPNKCASTHRAAFTAMAVLGYRYDIDTRDLRPASEADLYGGHFGIGAELGYFYIRDVFRNTEVVLRSTYYPGIETLSVNLGIKFFLNLREFGRY